MTIITITIISFCPNGFKIRFFSTEAINCLNRAIEIYTDMVRVFFIYFYFLLCFGGIILWVFLHLVTLIFLNFRVVLPSRPNITSASQRSTRQNWWTSTRSGKNQNKRNDSLQICNVLKMLSFFRLLLITNKQQIITKVKNPPGNYLFLESDHYDFDVLTLSVAHIWLKLFCFQFGEQVPSESGDLRRSAGAVPESHRDLRTGEARRSSPVCCKTNRKCLFIFVLFLGGNLRDGQHAPEVQRQGSLLQSGTVSFLRRHAECEGKQHRAATVSAEMM